MVNIQGPPPPKQESTPSMLLTNDRELSDRELEVRFSTIEYLFRSLKVEILQSTFFTDGKIHQWATILWCLPTIWFFAVLIALLIDFWSAYRTADWLLKCLSHYWLIFLTKDVTTVFHTYETGLRTGTIHPKVRNADENIHLTNRKCYSRWELKNPWKNWIGKSKKNISYRSKFNASHIGAINLNTNWYPRFSTIYTDRILISQ